TTEPVEGRVPSSDRRRERTAALGPGRSAPSIVSSRVYTRRSARHSRGRQDGLRSVIEACRPRGVPYRPRGPVGGGAQRAAIPSGGGTPSSEIIPIVGAAASRSHRLPHGDDAQAYTL